MKLSRRNALMAAVGSIFGGKEAAKSILKSDSMFRAGGVALKTEDHGIETFEGSINAYPSDKIQGYDEQIAKLTKLINGSLEDWQEAHLQDFSNYRRSAEMFRIDGLKSIAPHCKLSMIDRLHKKRMREEWVKEAKRELKNVLGYKDNLMKMMRGEAGKYGNPSATTQKGRY